MAPLILGSGSPRRLSLLTIAGFEIAAVIPPDIPERRAPNETPLRYVRRLAAEKAAAVPASNAWVLAADTVVHDGLDVFEKPTDDTDGFRMLRELSGRWHRVTSAWCVEWKGPQSCPADRRRYRGERTSRVKFRSLTDREIRRYIQTGEGTDKAGGYAVQGEGAALIERVVGSTTNVVGLPLDSVIPTHRALHIHGSPR